MSSKNKYQSINGVTKYKQIYNNISITCKHMENIYHISMAKYTHTHIYIYIYHIYSRQAIVGKGIQAYDMNLY